MILRKILSAFLFLPIMVSGQQSAQNSIESRLKPIPGKSLAETMIITGESFTGLPYVAATLEVSPEQLVCRTDAFDCYTFVENVLAISLTRMSTSPDYARYTENLQKLRYRNGRIDGYASRIHYFTDWAQQAESLGIVKDLTREWGNKTGKVVNFMGTHRNLYPAFATDNQVWTSIQEMEKKLATYGFYEIPKAKFTEFENRIKDGDIIAFTSGINGLDVNHEGIAVWRNGKLRLLHASQELKKVVVSPETLGEYLQRIKKHTGIMVIRPL